MACSRNVVMAQKIIASQFRYASRAIATPERARARFRQGDRPSLDCGPCPTYPVPMTASHLPPLRSKCAKKSMRWRGR